MSAPHKSPWPAWLLLGPLFLVAGVGIGQLLPSRAEAGERIWRDAEYSRQPEPLDRAVGVPSLAPIVERVAGGVVTVRSVLPIDAEGQEHSDGGDLQTGSNGVLNGTGFLINQGGLVVTSRHLVAQAMVILVNIPRHRRMYANLVGEDPVTDLAVLRLQDPPPGLPVLELGDSEDLRAGDWIVTVGNPFDYPLTVTAGVVSFVGRHLRHYDLKVTNDFLQFSAAVNPGSSGSPVLDLHGRVVGVTTQAAVSAQGISFAIPSRTLKWVLKKMDESPDGRVHRGFLGIGFESRSEEDYENGEGSPGALITSVTPGQPADQAGLLKDDVVLYFEGHPIRDAADLHEQITRRSPGTAVELTVLRGGELLEPIEVRLGEVGAGSQSARNY